MLIHIFESLAKKKLVFVLRFVNANTNGRFALKNILGGGSDGKLWNWATTGSKKNKKINDLSTKKVD